MNDGSGCKVDSASSNWAFSPRGERIPEITSCAILPLRAGNLRWSELDGVRSGTHFAAHRTGGKVDVKFRVTLPAQIELEMF
jgi:hypothetical protein